MNLMKPGDLVRVDWKGLRLGLIVSRSEHYLDAYDVLLGNGSVVVAVNRMWLEVIDETR